MTFLYATLICMGVPLFFMYWTINSIKAGSSRLSFSAATAWVVGTIFALGIGVGLFSPREMRTGDTNWSPIILLAGAGAGLAVFGFMAYRSLRASGTGAGSRAWQGAWVISTCSSLYIGYAALDHVLFWKDKDRVGVATSLLFDKTDVKCKSDLILLKRDGNAFIYRCPHNIALGNMFTQPFVPWPSYDEGRSELLFAEYEQIRHEAERSAHSIDLPAN